MKSFIPRYDIILDNMKSYDSGTFHACRGCHPRLYAWYNEHMFSSLRLNPRQWQCVYSVSPILTCPAEGPSTLQRLEQVRLTQTVTTAQVYHDTP